MGVRAEQAAQTKEELVSAFWQLYKTKPISQIRAKDVADAAGYYCSTLYYHFADVYAILEYIETTVLQQWEQMLAQAITKRQAIFFHGDVGALLMLVSPFFERNSEYIAVLLGPSGDPQFQQKIKDTLRMRFFSLLEIPTDAIEPLLLFEGISSCVLAVFVKGYDAGVPVEVLAGMMPKIITRELVATMLSYSRDPQIRQYQQDEITADRNSESPVDLLG